MKLDRITMNSIINTSLFHL